MTIAIVRDPIYQQLCTALRELLKTYSPGQKFLSERQISQQFEVSRTTANKALSNLVIEGSLDFKKGIGTFVSGTAVNYDLQSLVSFTHKAKSAGRKPTTRVLKFESPILVNTNSNVQSAFNLPTNTPLKYVERLRLLDGQPVILERRYIVANRCKSLTKRDLQGSLYQLFTDRFNLNITAADQTISAVNISRDDAKLLEVPFRSAGLQVVATGILDDNTVLWYEQTLYRGDAYNFQNHVGNAPTDRLTIGELVANQRSNP